jgi:hypothetical protein
MQNSTLPGHAEQPTDILCGSCGRFVGAQTRCPHCGAGVQARLSIKLFRVVSVLLATVGLGLLYLMAVKRQIPLIEIGSISPTMNFAYVRVTGNVDGEVRISRDGRQVRSVRFNVDDGTGVLPVSAYGPKGQALVVRGLVPRTGDRVEVTGSLNVSADRVALWLQSPDQLTLTRAETPVATLDSLGAEQVGRTVTVRGTIRDVSAPDVGTRRPWKVALEDGSATHDIVFWSDVHDALPDPGLLRPGARLDARVRVGRYRDELQLKAEGPGDLLLTPGAAPGEAP